MKRCQKCDGFIEVRFDETRCMNCGRRPEDLEHAQPMIPRKPRQGRGTAYMLDEDGIAKQFEKGMPVAAIARRHGVTVTPINRVLYERGLKQKRAVAT